MDKEHKVCFQIRAINNAIKRDIERTHPKELDISTGIHGWAIGYFYRNRDRDVFQRDFEEEFSIRRSTATKMLQLMEKNGLIVRSSVDYDARLKKITLTEKAVDIHNLIIEDIERREERITKNISRDEITAFLTTLKKLRANLEVSDD